MKLPYSVDHTQTSPIQEPSTIHPIANYLSYVKFSDSHKKITNPRQPHLDALYQILRYLKATPSQGIILSCTGGTNLVTYSDSDWLGFPMTR